MKILVFSGSPKGDSSITLHYIKYLEKKNKNIIFEVVNVSQKIKKIENDMSFYNEIIKKVENADGILWVTPVYHFTVPGQMMRFIELISERNSKDSFKNKYSTLFTTSIHFFDNMAENYIQEISEDLGMKYIKGMHAYMDDIKDDNKRENFMNFFHSFFFKIENKVVIQRRSRMVQMINKDFETITQNENINIGNYKIVAVTDYKDANSSTAKMYRNFAETVNNQVEEINLPKLNVKSGCIGCCFCGSSNICTIKDDLNEVYSEKLKEADVIVYFVTIKNRYFSSEFKTYHDRSFVNGHAPVYKGKKVMYFVSGPLSQINNIQEEIKARAEVSMQHLVGVVSDEVEDSSELSALISGGVKDLKYALENNLQAQQGFYEVSGHKIFRDFIYFMKWIFSKDHAFYKNIGFYDFPTKSIAKSIFSTLINNLLKVKRFRIEFNKKMNSQMGADIKKAANQA